MKRSVAVLGALLATTAALVLVPAVQAQAAIGSSVYSARTGPANTSERFKQVVVDCPPGTQLLGGGGSISPVTVGAMLTALIPAQVPTPDGRITGRFIARAELRRDLRTTPWILTSYAVCGPVRFGVMIFPTAIDAAPASASDKTADAVCPGDLQPIGTGGEIFEGDGGVSFREIAAITDWRPDAPGHVVVAAHRDEFLAPLPTGFRVRAYAICVHRREPMHVRGTGNDVHGTSAHRRSDAGCPEGTEAHAAGVMMSDPHGRAYVTAIVPGAAPHRDTAYAEAAPQAGALSWVLDSQLVCAS